jgi:hypothetical protein
MELLLNLLWLTLALPALWVWRRAPEEACGSPTVQQLRAFLILSCLLVLLFPVVSATDDLHAMQQEMEESSPSKRTVRQSAGNSFASAWPTADGFFVQPVSQASICHSDEVCGASVPSVVPVPEEALTCPSGPRAPPQPFLG